MTSEGPAAPFLVARVGAEGDPSSYLELRREGEREGRGVRCDLSTISLRGGRSEARGMPVCRAMGDARTVVDATAGLLGDAFLLAAAGFEVVAIERSPLIHAIAADGLARAMRDARLKELIGDRLRLVHADARDWLRTRAGTPEAPDAVLIDPMFPPKKKSSALPRKEMVALREVVGADVDAAELLAMARASARHRVILKRADDSTRLGEPDWTIEGTTIRFDVWRGSTA
ncbi:MAG: class I SAM-dependent methyltransferase [Phycisphaerales bacterium]